MKKTVFALAALGAFAGAAQAQSSVTLYGIVDAAIRYHTNSALTAAGDSRIGMESGYLNTSRWGLRGVEDLGGGMKGTFNLESDLAMDTGNNAGSFFNRVATVGVGGGFGQIDLGRDYNMIFKALATVDPLGFRVTPQNQNILISSLHDVTGYGNSGAGTPTAISGQTAIRANNSIQYTGNFAGVTIGAQYGFGEMAGNNSASSTWGLRLGYGMGPLALAGAYQQWKNATSDKLTDWAAGAAYTFGPARLAATYASAKVDSTDSKRNVIGAGVDYKLASNMGLNLTYYRTEVKNATFVGANPPTATTVAPGAITNNAVGKSDKFVLLAQYDLSKRTALYGLVDYTKFKDGFFPAGGTDKQSGITIGARHSF